MKKQPFYSTRKQINQNRQETKVLRYHVLQRKRKTGSLVSPSLVVSRFSLMQVIKKLNIIYCIGYYYSNKVPCDHFLSVCTELRIQ